MNKKAEESEQILDLSEPEEGEPEEGAFEGAENLLELVLAEHEARVAEQEKLPERIDGVLVGRFLGFDAAGQPVVDYPGCAESEGVAAKAMASLTEAEAGREVALLFEGGDPNKPVIMGLMFQAGDRPRRAPVFERTRAQATVDGERLVFSAEKEIVLACGDASITLTRAGKILIKGAYLLTRSSGVNRIQGGSVEIN